jgi:hypothetical protein
MFKGDGSTHQLGTPGALPKATTMISDFSSGFHCRSCGTEQIQDFQDCDAEDIITMDQYFEDYNRYEDTSWTLRLCGLMFSKYPCPFMVDGRS